MSAVASIPTSMGCNTNCETESVCDYEFVIEKGKVHTSLTPAARQRFYQSPTGLQLQGLKAKFDIKPWSSSQDRSRLNSVVYAARHTRIPTARKVRSV